MSFEIWKQIPMLPRFEVGNTGRVRFTKTGRVRSVDMSTGYARVTLQYQRYSIHALVARVFIGPCPPGLVVNHKNGRKDDNRPENLEYVTHSENLQHAYDVLHRKGPEGEIHGRSKLTESQVKEIFARRQQGESSRVLAAEFNVSAYTVWDICKGNIWRHLGLTA